MSAKLRKDMDDVSEKTGIPLKRCRRQVCGGTLYLELFLKLNKFLFPCDHCRLGYPAARCLVPMCSVKWMPEYRQKTKECRSTEKRNRGTLE